MSGPKSTAKLAGLSLLGFLAALVIYWVLIVFVDAFRSRSGHSPESMMMPVFSIVVPIAFLLGGLLTGYLGQPHLKSKPAVVLVAPGLYPSLFMISANVIMVYVVKDTSVPLLENLLLLGVFLSWFLSSWAGVWMGCRMRSRMGKDF
jgi:hypothetical protein